MLSVVLFNDSEWTYSSGAHWWGGWVGFILLLVPTFFANLITLILVTYSPRLNRSSSSLMVRYLCVEDGLFSLFCLIQCSINLSQKEIVGFFIGCEVQAIYALFFMLATGWTLCCIAYNSHQKISFKPGLSPRAVFWLHLLIWAFSGLIAVLCSYVIADARIMPSSTYCLVSLVSLQAGLVFYILGVLTIGAFLSHRYFLIYCQVTRQGHDLVTNYAAQKQLAQMRQITVAKRMAVIVCAYFLCAMPTVITSIVECIIGESAPPEIHVWAGHMIHLNSLLNPILYVWLNSSTRAALWELFGYRKRMSSVRKGPAGGTGEGGMEEVGEEEGKVEDDVNDAVNGDELYPNTTNNLSSSIREDHMSAVSISPSPQPMGTRFLTFSSRALFEFHRSRLSQAQAQVQPTPQVRIQRASLALLDSPPAHSTRALAALVLPSPTPPSHAASHFHLTDSPHLSTNSPQLSWDMRGSPFGRRSMGDMTGISSGGDTPVGNGVGTMMERSPGLASPEVAGRRESAMELTASSHVRSDAAGEEMAR